MVVGSGHKIHLHNTKIPVSPPKKILETGIFPKIIWEGRFYGEKSAFWGKTIFGNAQKRPVV